MQWTPVCDVQSNFYLFSPIESFPFDSKFVSIVCLFPLIFHAAVVHMLVEWVTALARA